jgi:hypothetical protein
VDICNAILGLFGDGIGSRAGERFVCFDDTTTTGVVDSIKVRCPDRNIFFLSKDHRPGEITGVSTGVPIDSTGVLIVVSIGVSIGCNGRRTTMEC